MLPLTAAHGLPGKAAIDMGLGPAQGPAAVTAPLVGRQAAAAPHALSAILLPRPSEMVLGLANVLRPPPEPRSADPQTVEGGLMGAQEIPR